MKRPTALITGSSGGIGQALCKKFASSGFDVVATDQVECSSWDGIFIEADLLQVLNSTSYRSAFLDEVHKQLGSNGLDVLINNAALQCLGRIETLSLDDFQRSFSVNLMVPFLLVKELLPQLETAAGAVVNIGSIHECLTKAGFSAYASSKAGLGGLTRSLAVELGGRVRVNAINPAAIETEMLKAGFVGKDEAFEQLAKSHPAGVLGSPDDVADIAYFLASTRTRFFTGTTVDLNGGIGSRLYDPA